MRRKKEKKGIKEVIERKKIDEERKVKRIDGEGNIGIDMSVDKKKRGNKKEEKDCLMKEKGEKWMRRN